MELLYLYIGGREKMEDAKFRDLENSPYKVLKDIELNFSNKYVFSFNKTDKQLVLTNNKQYVSNFFDRTGKIKSVTGIIGKNGTGKSSILDLIMSLRKDNYHHHFYKLIIVYSEDIVNADKRKETVFKVYYHPDLEFSPVTAIKDYESAFNEGSKVSIKDLNPYQDVLPTYKLIYYSTIFEIKTTTIKEAFEVYGDENLEDISTAKLIESDAEYQTNSSTKGMSAPDVIRRHKLMETDRQVQFIYNIKNAKDFLDFDPPQILELTVDHIDEITIKKSHPEAYNFLMMAFDNYLKENKLSSKDTFIFQVHRAAFFNTMRYFLDNPITFDDLNKLLDNILKRDVRPENIRNFLSKIGKGFEEELVRKNIQPLNPVSEQLYLLESLLASISKLTDGHCMLYAPGDVKAYIDLRIEEEYLLLKKYFDAVNLSGFIVAEWRFSRFSTGEMSSGEKGLISLFSRFYYVLSRAEKFEKKNKSLLILIDEGDQLFHPEWQRKFMARILKYFVQIFGFAESIQIILTTHSPFIASDLPPYSIIKLNKKEGMTIAENLTGAKSTFAANIHELFTDSFYLEKGLVGEFAINKVKEMFAILNSSNDLNNSQIEREIELVGEPFVKASLEERLKERRNINE